jgi:superfamily II DNA/RNA helicase
MTEFSELGLSPEILQAVFNTGYTTATPIQAEAIPVALTGKDVLGIAQTGTGKTAAFTLPMIERLASGRSRARMPRALVIAPTRELADQVSASFERYSAGQARKLSWALLIGGVSFSDQELKLDRGVDVLIATPGRLLDHFERGKLLLTGVQILVVDEADRMLDMGFIPDIERIFKLTPPKKQILFFSATMPPEITRLTKQFLNDPVRIEVAKPATTAETIAQHIVRLPTSDPKAKRTALRMLIENEGIKNGIVFCNRKSEVDIVAKSLRTHGLDAAAIHGDLDQQTRMRTLDAFRNGDLKLLCASDVAARGLDIPDVSHVFNYDVPHHAEDYVHRIGRTGRAGKFGRAFMIVTPADAKNIDKVLKLIGKEPEEVVLEGVDFSAIKDTPRDDRKGGRGAARGRDRDRDRERGRGRDGEGRPPRRERAEPQAIEGYQANSAEPTQPEVAQASPEADTGSETQSRRSRSARSDGRTSADAAPRTPRTAEPAEAPARNSRQEPSGRRRDSSQEEDRQGGKPVVGFGSELPAFLTRPITSGQK